MKENRRPIILLFIFLIFTTKGYAQNSYAVVHVEDKTGNNLSESVFQDIVEALLSKDFTVVTRSSSDMDSITKEMNLSLSGFISPSAAIKVGQWTGANKIVSAVITSVKVEEGESVGIGHHDGKDILTIGLADYKVKIQFRVIDTEKGELLKNGTGTFDATESSMVKVFQKSESRDEILERLVKKVIQKWVNSL